MSDYERWIQENVTGDGRGKCREWSFAMVTHFPELKLVRGHYHCSIVGERPHWWLVAQNGCIVDPTRNQFPSMGTDEYVPWDESQDEPTGICANCGKYNFRPDTCCSEKCGLEYAEFCKGGVTP
jgi:hypothetical protein